MSKQKNAAVPLFTDWQALYNAALEFKEIAPWDWMSDLDIFGVKNPYDGEIGYCCVLGTLGEVLGLVVYLGTEGLDGYLKVRDGVITIKDDDILHTKKCLAATFEDNKSSLEKPDLDIIKNLGFKFSGANAWPLFRSYEPGFYPWYLTQKQAQYLTFCLQQAKEVVLRFKGDRNLFNPFETGSYFVKACDDAAGNGNWKDIWLKPVSLQKVVSISKTFDQRQLDAFLEKFPHQKQSWEMDYFYAPTYIAEKSKRPYFPLTFLFVDSYSHFIFNVHITTPDKYLLELHEQFLLSLQKAEVLPQEIRIRKEELFVFLEPLADRLGIKMKVTNDLPALDDARKAMFEHFGRRKS